MDKNNLDFINIKFLIDDKPLMEKSHLYIEHFNKLNDEEKQFVEKSFWYIFFLNFGIVYSEQPIFNKDCFDEEILNRIIDFDIIKYGKFIRTYPLHYMDLFYNLSLIIYPNIL